MIYQIGNIFFGYVKLHKSLCFDEKLLSKISKTLFRLLFIFLRLLETSVVDSWWNEQAVMAY